jgi:integrase
MSIFLWWVELPKKWEVEFETEVQEYLDLKSQSTAHAYSNSFARFLEFYQSKYGKDANFGHFLDRIFEERKKPRREQKRIAEIEVSQFIDFLKDKGLSNNTIRMYFAAVQNFLKWKEVIISMSFINVPPPVEKIVDNKKVNGKHEWKIDQIKEFVGEAKSYRDKAIIACIFQSGLAVKEICNLNYGDIKKEFEAGILPICLRLIRQKTNVEFKTFFGRDAVKYLKLYLATKGELKPEDPLFVKQRARGGEERITSDSIEQFFSEIAQKVDFIEVREGHYNPARPHSLRAAFNSRLINKIDKDLREFWMGHAVGGVARAYLNMPTEDMRKLYMTAEEFLKIELSSREEKDETSKAKGLAGMMMEAKIKELEQRVELHEEMFRKMTDMTFEEFCLFLQESNRWLFQHQQEEDKRQFSNS